MDDAIKALKQIRDEYIASAEHMQKIVDKFDTYDHLSESAKQILRNTAESLQVSSVVDVDSNNFFLQQSRRAIEESKLSRKKLQFEHNIKALSVRNSSLQQRTQELMRDIEVAKMEHEDSKDSMERTNIDVQFTKDQIEKYRKELNRLKEQEKQMGILDPEELKLVQERVKAIAEMKIECDAIKSRLEKYEGLPPNLEQAEQVVAQTINKHEEENKRMKAKIQSITLTSQSWNQ
ncbi:hypothetical protein L9F63_001662 [Diploptera punctata]|uniref:Uncharacterized protein n=1 Tax=Diploptera punctata TaxID=6984 RepID=A0AAD8A380_DIPPU|nr:hypothetical protein L9F63_001662 [Diploptera punctata]